MNNILHFNKISQSPPRSNLLLIGGETQLGKAMQMLDWPENIRVVFPTPTELSTSDPGQISAWVSNGFMGDPWLAVVNCAEYVPIKGSKGDQVMSWLINAVCPASIGEAATLLCTPVVHCVTKVATITLDKVSPQECSLSLESHFHGSRLAGEIALRESGAKYIMLNAGEMIGPNMGGCIQQIVNALMTYKYVNVHDCLINNVIQYEDVAEAAAILAFELASGSEEFPSGPMDVTPIKQLAFSQLVEEVANILKRSTGITISVGSLPSETRTRNLPTELRRLNKSAFELLEIEETDWRISVKEVVHKILYK